MNSLKFSDLGISAPILKALDEMGFEAPSKIQAAAIPKIMEGRDVAGQAQTGTGKTAAFAIPVLEGIDKSSKSLRAIVMCPTRELAVQVTGEFIKLAKHMGGIYITPVYGGQPIQRQIKQIKSGTQIIVGTPGRVIDHLERGTIKLHDLKTVVLDEADEMLNMGFREDIEKILSYSEKEAKKQTIMFSATMSPEIKKIMRRFFQDPEMIKVEGKAASADGIKQYIVEARDSMRTEGICRLIDLNNYKLSLIFCNTKRSCDILVSEMQSRGYSSDALHGDMSQQVRDKVMNKFRRGGIDVLIATDVAARGLDVDDVDVVFNYDVPQDPEYYVHRIGRTGRAGKTGVAYTFSSRRKSNNLRFIERMLKINIETIPLPSDQDVAASVRGAYINEITSTLEKGGLRPYIEQIESLCVDKFTPIEVAAAMLKMHEDSKKKQSVKASSDNKDTDYDSFDKPKRNRKPVKQRGSSSFSRSGKGNRDKKPGKRQRRYN